ncbi:MAG: phage virion morphogenesis protein [Leptolyngbyaceae cyanobacterium MO_188.B28]|nr:phage virion morphogenesis protein [Leptolyngbyaceae cyanobacterium MO_188.B28]
MTDPIFSLSYQDQRVQNLLAQLQQRTSNLRPVLAEIGEEMLRRTDLRFEREEDPSGVKWRPLSARTIAWKQANSRILKRLQSTGRLRASITYRVESDRVIIGTNVSYAYKHQLGVGVPQRQFLGINQADEDEIIAILQDHLI